MPVIVARSTSSGGSDVASPWISYLADLLAGFLLIGLGIGFSFVPISIAALAGVEPHQAGLASGLINTSQQLGGALGIAILSTVATSTTRGALADRSPPAFALTDGFEAAFWVAAVSAAVGLAVALTLIRRRDLERTPSPAEPVPMTETP